MPGSRDLSLGVHQNVVFEAGEQCRSQSRKGHQQLGSFSQGRGGWCSHTRILLIDDVVV